MPLFLGHQCCYSFHDGSLPKCQGQTDFLCTCWSVCLKTWRNEPLTSLMLFVLTRFKTVLIIMLLQSSCLDLFEWLSLGYSPQVGSNEIPFSSCYRLFIDYFCQQNDTFRVEGKRILPWLMIGKHLFLLFHY